MRGELRVAYPTRFVSKKTGRAGYAPACSNQFVAGVCELPKVKCGDCTNQAFRPVDDDALLAHLRGKHVMGVYPMLPDETCWFLAVDFDKSTWKEDVGAFAETARRLGLPALVERSRSGNGAHVWFFFSEPVLAATARKVGRHLVTETMASHHALSMDSYDRLFPSQDTMPRGGFGNLIALPLQHGPRQATAVRTRGALGAAKLAEMIEEATVDAYGEGEQATGWFTVIGDNLDMPFDTNVLGVAVTVKRLELLDDNSIVAVCARAARTQAIRIVDLPLPSPKPEGAEWIEAYRHWLGGDGGASSVDQDP